MSAYGNGATPEEAAANYAPAISLKRLAIGAYTEGRREIQVPRLSAGGARFLSHRGRMKPLLVAGLLALPLLGFGAAWSNTAPRTPFASGP